jgi:hypothetical protein
METGTENQNQNQNPTPVVTTSDNLFEDMAKNMENGIGTIPLTPQLAAGITPATETKQEEVKPVTVQAPETTPEVKTEATPTVIEEDWTKLNPFSTEEKPAEIDHKTRAEKLEQEKAQLEQQVKSMPEWVKKLAAMAADEKFDYDKWIASQQKEDFSRYSAEEVYNKYLDGQNLTPEEKEAELELFKNKSLYEKTQIKNGLAKELSEKSKAAGDPDALYREIMAAREQEDKEWEAQQQQVEQLRKEISELPIKVVGQKIGGLEITKELAEKAVQPLLNGHLTKDGKPDYQTPFLANFVYQNYTTLVTAAIEKEKQKWISERSNPSGANMGLGGKVMDDNPIATGLKNFLDS